MCRRTHGPTRLDLQGATIKLTDVEQDDYLTGVAMNLEAVDGVASVEITDIQDYGYPGTLPNRAAHFEVVVPIPNKK